jgi:hypothetical protein
MNEEAIAAANEGGDTYPDFSAALEWALSAEDFPQGEVDRFELTLLASNEATWRAWPAKAEDYVGGHKDFGE